MRHIITTLIALVTLLAASAAGAADLTSETYDKLVDKSGNIKLPKHHRLNWAHLGSWVVADAKAPGYGFHDVYTQPDAVKAYRKTGKFPDGTMLIKEIRHIVSSTQTTGDVLNAGDKKLWFVMVKNNKHRFADNMHWVIGWGWALFMADKPEANVSKGFKET